MFQRIYLKNRVSSRQRNYHSLKFRKEFKRMTISEIYATSHRFLPLAGWKYDMSIPSCGHVCIEEHGDLLK